MRRDLFQIVQKYENLKLINGQKRNCPYWMNKLKDGEVFIRGQFNGKGSWQYIQSALNSALKKEHLDDKILPQEKLQKLARRHRIGIDCSGFVYRVFEHLGLSNIFPENINHTNANIITTSQISLKVDKIKDIRPLDLIRMLGGKHIAVVINKTDQEIEYAHSSDKTVIQGVHRGTVQIRYPEKGLESQLWAEKTKKGENFGKKYFNPQRGDSVRRLKFFYE